MKVFIDGTNKLQKKLQQLAEQYGQSTKESVTVGFTQRYALYVHEVQTHHKVGQWKYLEAPARKLKHEMARMMSVGLRAKMPVMQCLMMAGLRLQRDAQTMTPIDTSALKASAFTCPTKNVEGVSRDAYKRSEGIRIAELSLRKKMGRKP